MFIPRYVCLILFALLAFGDLDQSSTAQEQPSGQGSKYPPSVVEKASKILEENGLTRSGKTIRTTRTAEVSRAITALSRQRRELRLANQDWKKVASHAALLRAQLKSLDAQQGKLALQLAQVAGRDTSTNNKLVGLIEATRVEMRKIVDNEKAAKEELSKKRASLIDAESKYAESVLAIRSDFDLARDSLAESLKDEKVKIALNVMFHNFQTPKDITTKTILLPLEKRIEKIEQEIFSETIDLDVRSGSMFVNVNIGDKSARMVVDSGATMVSLPFKTATELGIKIPADARELKLVLADGNSIPGRLVTLERVRVGQFEAENVQAAILDPIADNAEPLLGMSFLGNFKFEIDANEKTLKMLRVASDK